MGVKILPDFSLLANSSPENLHLYGRDIKGSRILSFASFFLAVT